MIRHCTYTDHNMTISAALASSSAINNGCSASTIYTVEDLDKDFKKRNSKTLAEPRGAGYWIWKPQVIWQELHKWNFGDVVVYTDAGVEFISDIRHLVNKMGDNFCFLFQSTHTHSEWTKGDILAITNSPPAKQLQATAMLFRNTPEAKGFVFEWLQLCQIPDLITDAESKLPNAPGFKENRHDQSIITELQLKYNIKAHWWPARYNNKFNYSHTGHNDYYPITFNHHRKRNDEWPV